MGRIIKSVGDWNRVAHLPGILRPVRRLLLRWRAHFVLAGLLLGRRPPLACWGQCRRRWNAAPLCCSCCVKGRPCRRCTTAANKRLKSRSSIRRLRHHRYRRDRRQRPRHRRFRRFQPPPLWPPSSWNCFGISLPAHLWLIFAWRTDSASAVDLHWLTIKWKDRIIINR